MVWIHGGGFISGTIFDSAFDGRYLATSADMVIVAINYRLGPFGFLYGHNDKFPGNLGLRDQLLALGWVKDNIHHFGGNPEKVTIFGESAGSMSVGALVLSPMSKGLFHRAILQSGSPNSYLGSERKEKSLNKTFSLAAKFNCPLDSVPKTVQCLREQKVEDILMKSKNSILDGESFIPIYGEQILPLEPVTALKSKKFNQVDLLFGVNSGEGAGFLVPFLPQLKPDANISASVVNNVVDFMFQMLQVPYHKEVADFYSSHVNASNQDDLK